MILKKDNEKMRKAYVDVVSYFGEETSGSSLPKPSQFFGIFKEFLTSFEKALQDNTRTAKNLPVL